MYKALRNQCTSEQRKDRKHFLRNMYRKIEMENDSVKLYSLTKQLLGWKQGSPPARFELGGRSVTRQSELAEAQVNYTNKVKTIKDNLPRVRRDPLQYLKLAFRQWVPLGGITKFKLEQVIEIKVK